MPTQYQTYSRKTKVEEKRNIRNAILFGVLTIALLVLFVLFGFGIIAKFVVFLGDIKKGNAPVVSDDTTPPIPPRFEPIPKATNNQQFDIKGSTEPGADVELTVNGEEHELLANSDGEFQYTANLETGENSIIAYSKDSAGNKSPETDTQTIVYDNTPPQLDITKPQDGASFYGSKQRQLVIEGKTEANTQVSVSGRHVVVDGNGGFTYLMTLSEGENALAIKVQDLAGNITEKDMTVTYSP
jgi:hypothetical protein